MATHIHGTEFQAGAPAGPAAKPALQLIRSEDPYAQLERPAPGVARRGVHPHVLVALVGLYAMILAAFWGGFARDAGAIGALVTVSLFMLVYFSLLVGGILLADSAAPGEDQRSFADFMHGSVAIATGTIAGREAAVQILSLPAAMMALAAVIGVIARLS